jgi:hypothetical protein
MDGGARPEPGATTPPAVSRSSARHGLLTVPPLLTVNTDVS